MMSYSLEEISLSLERIEAEAAKLKTLTEDIPAVQKNIVPIISFIDILKFHLDDLREKI
jgi:hypothetical protein